MVFFIRRHLVAIIILLSGIILLTTAFFLLRGYTNRVGRDFERVVDAQIIRSSFERMYQDSATYADANCVVDDPLQVCIISDYDSNLATRRDPFGAVYTVKTEPDDSSFGISFTLEGSYRGLEAGEHVITQDGFQ